MDENLHQSAQKTSIRALLRRFRGEFASSMGAEALHEYLQEYFKRLNVLPVYLKEQEGKVQESRQRLNKEAGIVIANHPGETGDIEALAILNCLTRTDFKIMVDERDYPGLCRLLGETHVVTAFQDKRLLPVMLEIESHINNRGLFLIFPSGGVTTEFKVGLPSLLGKLSSEKMVYSFCVNPDDVSDIEQGLGLKGLNLTSADFILKSLDKRLPEQKLLRVDEHYSTVGQWQAICAYTVTLKEKSALLTEHYQSLFASPRN